MNKLEKVLIRKGDEAELARQLKEIETAWGIMRYTTHEKRGEEWLELEKELFSGAMRK